MNVSTWLRAYGASLVTLLALDFLWLGVIAREFNQRHLGHLLRPDVQWPPAVLFYLLYTAALVTIIVPPAVERRSLGRAVALSAFFGLAAYATYDLTNLAVMKDFPVIAAVADMAWGAALSAAVGAAGYLVARPAR